MNGLPRAGWPDRGRHAGLGELRDVAHFFGSFNLIKVVSLEAISEVQRRRRDRPGQTTDTLSGNVGLITKSGPTAPRQLLRELPEQQPRRRNQFLTTKPDSFASSVQRFFGGPIARNQLFAFGVYEGYRQDQLRRHRQRRRDGREYRALAVAAVPAYGQFFDTLPLPTQPYAAAREPRLYRLRIIQGNDDHVVVEG